MTERELALEGALRSLLKVILFNGPPKNIADIKAAPDYAYQASVPLAHVAHAQDVLGEQRLEITNPHLPEAYAHRLLEQTPPDVTAAIAAEFRVDDRRYGAAQHFRDD